MWHASLNGIDRYTASSIIARAGFPLIGPDLTGLIGGLGFVLAAPLLLALDRPDDSKFHPSKHDSSAESCGFVLRLRTDAHVNTKIVRFQTRSLTRHGPY